jgi:hypothetical protein
MSKVPVMKLCGTGNSVLICDIYLLLRQNKCI